MKNSISIKIGGQAGYGIMSTGAILGKACSRGGLYVCCDIQYPSLIRGGHNSYLLRVSEEEIFSFNKNVDLLVALNRETIDLHKDKLTKGSAIIYDGDIVKCTKKEISKDIFLAAVPLSKIANEHGGEVMRNTVSLGAVIAITGYDFQLLAGVINEIFADKGKTVIEQNINAAKAGYNYLKKNFKGKFQYKIKPLEKPRKRMFISGNEATALGAIKAGCKFFAMYPMTPASTILHYMAAKEREYNMVVRQPEDELAVMNMAIGAAHAGVRSMVATSGGGFCLMVEALGMAAMTETPVVIVEGQRAGPSTGLATHTEQGDLKFVLNASQGEFLRVVIAPGDESECFYKTAEAFNLAEKYQIPVIILSDKHLGEIPNACSVFDQKEIKIERGKILSEKEVKKIGAKDFFKRYAFSKDGVSPRVLPGTKGGMFVACSYEHDEYGNLAEDEKTRNMMVNRRFLKLEHIRKELPKPEIIGSKNADVTIIGWGSTKRAILEAMKMLEKDGVKANYLQVVYMKPFHSEEIAKIIKSSKQILLVENNKTSQLADVIRENTGLDIINRLNKYSGRPFYPEEIVEKVEVILNKKGALKHGKR